MRSIVGSKHDSSPSYRFTVVTPGTIAWPVGSSSVWDNRYADANTYNQELPDKLHKLSIQLIETGANYIDIRHRIPGSIEVHISFDGGIDTEWITRLEEIFSDFCREPVALGIDTVGWSVATALEGG